MNKTYRSVWNEATGTWVAAQENSKARGKRNAAKSVLALVALGAGSYSGAAFAGGAILLCPQGGASGGIGWAHGYVGQSSIDCNAATVAGSYVHYNFYLGSNADQNGMNGAGGVAAVFDDWNTNQLNLKGPGGINLYNTTSLNNNKIISLAAGTSSTDAVNVAQLTGVTKALGRGATVNADGSIQQPTYNVAGATYSNVGDALSGIVNGINPQLKYIQFGNTSASIAQAAGTDSIAIGGNAFANGSGALAIGAGARAQGLNSVAVGFGSATSAPNTFAVGSATSGRRIVNVVDGVNATDAATVGQVSADIAAAMANLNAGVKAQNQGSSQNGVLTSSTPGGSTPLPVVSSLALLGVTSSLPPDQLLASGPTDKGGMIKATGVDAMAIGLNTAATADNALAIGDNVQVGSAASVGVGQNIALSGNNTVVIGTSVSANANNAIVIGNNGTEADEDNAIAIGNNVAVGGVNTMAIGKDIVAVGVNSVTLGYASSDDGRANVLSVGSKAQQRQIVNMAAGTKSTDAVNVSQLSGAVVALGGGATVNATTGAVVAPGYTVQGQTGISDVGTAISKLDAAQTATTGNVTNVTNTVNNILIGGGIKYFHANSALDDSMAVGKDSIAIGGNATAATANSVALGANSVANSTTLASTPFAPTGYNTTAAVNNVGEVSVGAQFAQRRITNLAAGSASTDAVNVGQLATEDDKVNRLGAAAAAALGGSATYVPGNDPMFRPSYAVSGGTFTNVGDALTALNNAVTTGNPLGVAYEDDSKTQILLQGSGGTKISKLKAGDLSATSTDAVNGSQLYATNQNIVNLGNNITYINNSINNIINGEGIKYFHANSALDDSTAAGQDAVAIGGNAKATTANSVALGANSVANSTTLGTQGFNPGSATLSGGTAVGEVSIGAQDSERRLTHLAAGLNATDAVNLSQLKSEDAKVNAEGASIADVIGGTSTYDASTGKIANPTFVIGGSTVTTIGGAIMNLDARLYANSTDITNLQTQINEGGIGLVQQDGDTITVAHATGGTVVDFSGTAGKRKLTGVAAGAVNTSSFDAVNGTQLFNVAASTASVIGGDSTFDPSTGKITNPTYIIGGSTVTTIGGAIMNLDARVFSNSTDITNLQTQINEGGIGLVQQDGDTITVAHATGGNVVDFSGTAGKRKLTGLLDGDVSATSADAVNGAQLYGMANSAAQALGGDATVNGDGTISKPHYTLNGATVSSVGDALTNLDTRVAQNTTDITNLSGDILNINNVLNNINTGTGIKYFHANSTLADAQALGLESVSIGGGALAQGAGSIAMGSGAQALSDKSVALGAGATATGSNAVALGQGSVADRANSVSVGSAAQTRQITNVAAGTEDTDAVNLKQLKDAGIINGDGSTKTAVTYDTKTDDTGKTVTDYSGISLGGDGVSSTVIHNVAAGKSSSDAVNVQQMNDAISSAIVNVGPGVDPMFAANGDRNTEGATASGTHATAMGATSSASGVQSVATGFAAQSTGTNAVALGANATASGSNAVALGAGSVATEDNTVSVGSAAQQRRITNVANGTAAGDAVNVGQMTEALAQVGNQAVQSANAYTDNQFNKMNNKMNSLGAAAMAATSLIPNARAEGNFQMSAAAGTYGGAAAVAVGANYWVNDRVLVNAHVTRATGNGASTGASAGVTIGF
ncbi:ESPR-type extended signal peptide-containing protein [Paraburkholderia azotifigens]|uniref:ESPR-type extended signal peptide-containing protein n=1 Tax=Paraburkholderia azotifigens TaxID=2057004 RepID=UPI0038B9EC78